MNCWCGHGPWHHQGYPYPPQYVAPGYPPPAYPPSGYYPPQDPYDAPVRHRRRRRGRAPEELEDYLQVLQEEIDHVRRELAEMRDSEESDS